MIVVYIESRPLLTDSNLSDFFRGVGGKCLFFVSFSFINHHVKIILAMILIVLLAMTSTIVALNCFCHQYLGFFLGSTGVDLGSGAGAMRRLGNF